MQIYIFFVAYMSSLSDPDWKPFITKAWQCTPKDLRKTELQYNSILSQYSEEGENTLLRIFATCGPSLMRDAPNDTSLKIMLVLVEELSKYIINCMRLIIFIILIFIMYLF